MLSNTVLLKSSKKFLRRNSVSYINNRTKNTWFKLKYFISIFDTANKIFLL